MSKPTGLSGHKSIGGLHSQHHIHIAARTNVVIRHFVAILQLLTAENQSDLIRRGVVTEVLLLRQLIFNLSHCQPGIELNLHTFALEIFDEKRLTHLNCKTLELRV